MKQQRHKTFKVVVDSGTAGVIAQLGEVCAASGGWIIAQLLQSHVAEMSELLALVDTHPHLRDEVADVLENFGPETLMQSMQRIAPPGYQTMGEQLLSGSNEPPYDVL